MGISSGSMSRLKASVLYLSLELLPGIGLAAPVSAAAIPAKEVGARDMLNVLAKPESDLPVSFLRRQRTELRLNDAVVQLRPLSTSHTQHVRFLIFAMAMALPGRSDHVQTMRILLLVHWTRTLSSCVAWIRTAARGFKQQRHAVDEDVRPAWKE